MDDIRAFIAIELPQEVKSALLQIQTKLKTGRVAARWVAPDNTHLTLKFLGGISPDTAQAVIRVMEDAAIIAMPFQLQVSGLGVFPNPSRVQIIWCGVTGEIDKLTELQKEIDLGLSKLGFSLDSRPFTAHLTLARMRDEANAAEREVAGKLVLGTAFEGGSFKVDAIHLMRSELRQQGPIYSRIGSVSLCP